MSDASFWKRLSFIAVMMASISFVVAVIVYELLQFISYTQCHSKSLSMYYAFNFICIGLPVAATMVLVSIIYVLSPVSQGVKRSNWPLTLNLVAIIMAIAMWFVGFELVFRWRDFQFQVNRQSYATVARLVEEGKLKPTQGNRAYLPTEFRHLSRCDGEILIDTSGGVTRVFFWTFRDIEGETGFMYVSANEPPDKNDFPGVVPWMQREPIEPHWFRIGRWHD
jgi:hypothetical protein